MKAPLLTLLLVLAALARVPAAPRPQGGFYHFEKDGLSFDYPVAWTLADSSNAQLQSLVLGRAGASNVIAVFAQREPLTGWVRLRDSRESVTMPYLENLARKLGLEKAPRYEDARCAPVGADFAQAFRMEGRLGGEPTTAEVYRLVSGQRLIHLAHIRNDKDEAEGAPAWKALLDSLKVEPPPPRPNAIAVRVTDVATGGPLDAWAVEKPQPDYPAEAKAARAQGTVIVEIVVDGAGRVISAKAITGHALLRGAGERAARRAKFDPLSLCGRTMTGAVTYNFVLQTRR